MINAKTKTHLAYVLVFWLLGIAGFCWITIDKIREKNFITNHDKMIKAKLNTLDKMISGEEDISALSETVNDHGSWQSELEKFYKRKETIRPFVKSASTGSISLGTLLALTWMAITMYKNTKPELLVNSHSSGFRKKLPTGDSAQSTEKDLALQKTSVRKPAGIPPIKQKPVGDFLSNRSAYDFENINVMYCDEESANLGRRKTDQTNDSSNEKVFDKLQENIRETIISGYNEHVSKVDQSLKAQSQSLEKQVCELRQMAESVREMATEKNSSGDTVLTDLAQQISAIRDYACQQQNRNEKLQEGYDWNIIKNFCLRIIRCIDNIENRITKLRAGSIDTIELEEIRDELIFSLESSGVEQFTPEINSEYSGQEKFAEVTKQKVETDDKNKKGKIAEVTKPGYQYLIDDQNIRVVRTARVKIFE